LLLALFLALVAASPPLVERLRELQFDGYQRLFTRERQSAPVVIVEIDERALREFGQWPWPRTQMASLISAIAAARPAAIGLDLLFPEPDRHSPENVARTMTGLPADLVARLRELPTNDERFAQALRAGKTVLAVAGLNDPDARFPGPPQVAPVRFRQTGELQLRMFAGRLASAETIDRAAAGRGLISVEASDRIVRRVPVLAEVAGAVVPALSLEMWRLAAGAPPLIDVAGRADGLIEIRIGDFRVPAQRDGTMWLRYSSHDPTRFVSAAEMLGGNLNLELIKDKLVLVGVTGLGLLDYQATPLGERVPGVEFHAQLIEQMFDSQYLVRPNWAKWLELALLATGALLLIAVLPGRGVSASGTLLLLVLGAIGVMGAIAFRFHGILLDAGLPALGTLSVFIVLLATALGESDRQRRALREAAARIEGELDAARRIQTGLLPDPLALRETEPGINLDALLEPARQVGGDFFDFFKVDLNRLLFVVGDVSGKGMPAALFMALCKATLKAHLARGGSELGTSLTRAAGEIARENREDLFVTMFAGILDLRTGMVEYCNAGHEPPYSQAPEGEVARYPIASGPPLCVLPDYEYVTEYHQMLPGEWLCVVTDGVTEAANAEKELYGSERARIALQSTARNATAGEIIAALRDDVGLFVAQADAADDLTLLAMRWTGPAADFSAPASPD